MLLVGHVKGGDTKEKIFRNFGYARPEGYRKALRAMRLAEKFSRPIVVFVDTPAAYPGIESEERGVAEAIAVNLRDMMMLDTPIVVIVSGEGGSGGALGIAVGDRVLMQEFAIYSVIPPEGCAAILWRDPAKKVEAAAALKLTAPDLLKAGIIDEIIPEPIGGAHTDPASRPQQRGRGADAQSRRGRRADERSAAGGAVREVPQHGAAGYRVHGWVVVPGLRSQGNRGRRGLRTNGSLLRPPETRCSGVTVRRVAVQVGDLKLIGGARVAARV